MKKARTPNYKIVTSLGIIPFWKTIQCAVNVYYQNLYVKDQDINNVLSVGVNNIKVYLNYKIPAGNFWFVLHVKDNRLGIINHTTALTGMNLIL